MEKEKVLFISNAKFLDHSFPEGGVQFCTDEYIKLIKRQFDIETFPVEYASSILYKLRKKLGLTVYEDYELADYANGLGKTIKKNKIRYVFLNLTNTANFAELVRKIAPGVKIILCSHGNESGDFLHDIGLHNKYKSLQKKIAVYALGKMLVKEQHFRKYIDLVLTVSEVEVQIEKWLSAKKVFLVSRTFEQKTANTLPKEGRVGFLADLSHEPNYYGIRQVCEELLTVNCKIELRLVGSGDKRGVSLQKDFAFVSYLGYLYNEDLDHEIKSWSFALNPVFYYSRGVSTKLGKMLGEGIPSITTEKGLRGYTWKEGNLPICETPLQMASLILSVATDAVKINFYRNEVKKIQHSAPSLETMMVNILKILEDGE